MRECSKAKEVVKVYEGLVSGIEAEELEQFEQAFVSFAKENRIEKMKVFTEASEVDCFEQFGLALVNGQWKMVCMEGNNNEVDFYME